MIKMKNKKALEDSLAVWIIVIFILVFLIFVYLSVIGVKKLSGDKTPEVKIDSLNKNDLFLTQSFYGFLNKPIGDKNVRDLVYEWGDDSGDKGIVEEQFQDFVNNLDFECSIADVNSEGGKIRIIKPSDYGPVYSPPHQELFLEKGINLTLISEKNNLIKITVYAGECKEY